VRTRPPGPWRLAARSVGRDRTTLVLGGALALIVLACLAAPVWGDHVAGTGPNATHVTDTVVLDGRKVDVVALDGAPIGPTWHARYLLGADGTGRDFFVRLLYGGRNSLMIGIGAATLTTVIGTLLGLLAGYAGGWTDALVSRAFDLLWSFPVLLMGVALGTALTLGRIPLGPFSAGTAAKGITVLVIGLISIPYVARPVRARTQSLRAAAFVEAAEAMGAGRLRVVRQELVPNVAPVALVLFTLLTANAIILESALAFLGAGVQAPEASWGTLIRYGLDHTVTSPHLLIVPCAALTVTVLCLNVVGEAVRAALEPRS
jgi:peptide/nickel transport system permease protein